MYCFISGNCRPRPEPSTGFWVDGVWGGPTGMNVWSFDAWGE